MFSWVGKNDGHKHSDVYDNVTVGLQNIYKQKLLPLEKEYNFHDFHSPALEDPDFDARPMVMLVGQYSTGKTTFIRYLLEQDFPGIRIGPEPTTDRSDTMKRGNAHLIITCLFGFQHFQQFNLMIMILNDIYISKAF